MQMLLLPECFEHTVNLQSMEIRNLLNSRTPNEDITSAIDSAELHVKLHAKLSTFSEKVKDANQMDDLCI